MQRRPLLVRDGGLKTSRSCLRGLSQPRPLILSNLHPMSMRTAGDVQRYRPCTVRHIHNNGGRFHQRRLQPSYSGTWRTEGSIQLGTTPSGHTLTSGGAPLLTTGDVRWSPLLTTGDIRWGPIPTTGDIRWGLYTYPTEEISTALPAWHIPDKPPRLLPGPSTRDIL